MGGALPSTVMVKKKGVNEEKGKKWGKKRAP